MDQPPRGRGGRGGIPGGPTLPAMPAFSPFEAAPGERLSDVALDAPESFLPPETFPPQEHPTARDSDRTKRMKLRADETPTRPTAPSPYKRAGLPQGTDGPVTAEMRVLEPPVRSRGVLIVAHGDRAGTPVLLRTASTVFGRSSDADVHVMVDGVSARHARIVADADGKYTVEDLGSRNGTWVNTDRVVRRVLEDGSLLRFGPNAAFRFLALTEDEERAYRRAAEDAARDGLTGVSTRRHFDERLRAEVSYARRHDLTVSVIAIDVDQLARVNAEHGYSTGTAVLKQVAGITRDLLRLEDVLARLEGGEFLIALRDTDLLGAAYVADRIRTTIGGRQLMGLRGPLTITISGGCAALECCTQPVPEQLIDAARSQLAYAKRAGRNVIRLADSRR